MLIFIIGVILGVLVGIGLMSLCHASKEREEMETRLFEMWEKGEK